MKILIAEDDTHTREGLAEILQTEGYDVVSAADGEIAWQEFQAHQPDVVCLDVMMPRMDGYQVCQKIRKQTSEPAILFITAKSEEIDAVLGLELGADDFIQKPFGVKEVIARIRAVTRRIYAQRSRTGQPESVSSDFTMKSLRIVPDELRAYRDTQKIELSLRDIQILKLLNQNEGRAVNRDAFFDQCWGFEYMPNSRTLDQHISQLRKKIELDPRSPELIKTVHGVGYRYG